MQGADAPGPKPQARFHLRAVLLEGVPAETAQQESGVIDGRPGVCKGCKAQILWVATRSGKMMPVDPEKLSEWVTDEMTSGARKVTLQDPHGDTLTGWRASMLAPGARQIAGYVPHWSTCPNRDEFKRR